MTAHIFVRHAEARTNVSPHLIGGQSNNAELTPHGETQGDRLGSYFRSQGLKPDIIVTSGAVRSDETARLSLAAAGITIQPIVDERLLEISQGGWSGVERDHAYTPEMVEYLNRASIYGGLPGAETMAEAQDRMLEYLMEKSDAFPEGLVLSFGHGLAICALVGKIQGLRKQEILDLNTPNVSITRIDVTQGKPVVISVGERVITE